jgi:hypothetical protein
MILMNQYTCRVAAAAAFCLVSSSLQSCSTPGGIATATAPPKPAHISPKPEAAGAKAAFWDAFSAGRYDQIPQVLTRLTAAYLEYPYDPELALLTGHAHLWRVGERARDEAASSNPNITDDLIVAAFYFDQAARLSPDDQRIKGWLGGSELALGTVHNEQRLIRQGYFRTRDAMQAYPEFNGFTLGNTMSGADRNDERYAEALDAMWRTVVQCSKGRAGPDSPDYSHVAPIREQVNPDPACWNVPKAPHNFEGFWWALGIMEFKAGNAERGSAALRNAALSPTYAAWPFRQRLEQDLSEAEALTQAFKSGDKSAEERLLFRSAASCMACHQE